MKRPLAAVALALLWAGLASANFLDVETGARPMGMGGAFVAVADDVTAVHWNPAGLAGLEGFQLFGMRTSVYDVDGLSEDSVMSSYGTGTYGVGVAWMRTGVEDTYNEDTIVLAGGARTPIDGLLVGASLRRFSIDAPGYDYYADPGFDADGDAGYAGDAGVLYRRDPWSVGATIRNIGEPELQLIETTTDTDPLVSELRLGATYLFREIMLMSVEWRAPRAVPSYYDEKTILNIGTEIWFYDVVALRAGKNRDRITAGLGLKADPVRIDVALLSERRIGPTYRLSAILIW